MSFLFVFSKQLELLSIYIHLSKSAYTRSGTCHIKAMCRSKFPIAKANQSKNVEINRTIDVRLPNTGAQSNIIEQPKMSPKCRISIEFGDWWLTLLCWIGVWLSSIVVRLSSISNFNWCPFWLCLAMEHIRLRSIDFDISMGNFLSILFDWHCLWLHVANHYWYW